MNRATDFEIEFADEIGQWEIDFAEQECEACVGRMLEEERRGRRGSGRRGPGRRGPRPVGGYRKKPPGKWHEPPWRHKKPVEVHRNYTHVISRRPYCTCPAASCPQHDSEYIRWIQNALNNVLGLRLAVTGIMSVETRSALRSFQEKHGLPVDGIAGPETKSALVQARRDAKSGSGTATQAEGEWEQPADTMSISERDYLRWVQGSLNLYFEKNRLGLSVRADGSDSSSFRNAVAVFNARVTGRNNFKKIDPKFQNALIRENEKNIKFLKTIRQLLNKLGYSGLTAQYADHEKPVNAIKAFQESKWGLKFALKRDGFIGAKTFLALLHAIKSVESPKPPVPNVPAEPNTPNITISDDQLMNKLKLAEEYMLENGEPVPGLLCMVRQLANFDVDDKFVDARRMDQFFKRSPLPLKTYLVSARRILKVNLKTRYETGRTVAVNDFIGFVKNIQTDMIRGINLAYFQLTGVDIYDRWRKSEVKSELGARTKMSRSLYSCSFARSYYKKSIATL